ncbi:PIN domain-containing protein [Halothiobacillus sp. DCM-1]|uniref:PIN domain-containing protein n=1 Tax=Halothiobacillus sp. DCM-1 TaxID=3112558 RepID=UPI0032445638
MAKDVLDTLLFVDTNVLLDFYRIRKTDISLKYLEQLEACQDRLILGSQVEMEYKKNRQRAIVESLTNFGAPDWSKLTGPALVADLQAMKMIEKKKKEIVTQKNKVNEKIQNILSDPIHHDPVYQCLQRIFKHNSSYNLSRTKKERFTIRNLARKRFVLGYPPRKQGDTSIGDAVNWEWIVQCSINSSKHIVIVTRDTDYGAIYEGKSYLNDWLKQEFAERVSKKRKIILTDKLSQGLKIVHAAVTKEMEAEEDRLLAELLGDFEDLTVNEET